MRKSATLIAVPMLSASLLLTGCGGSSKTSSATAAAGTTSTSTAAGSAGASASDAAAQCLTEATQKLAKTRFVTNVGLAGGTFYQWIYKPYQAGKFTKGADDRTAALIKAGLAGAFAAKQSKDAIENVKADPTLCKVFIGPVTALSQQLDGLTDKVKSGDLSSITQVAGTVTGITDLAKQNGMEIDTSKSGL